MRLRRRSQSGDPVEDAGADDAGTSAEETSPADHSTGSPDGPFDADDLPHTRAERVDLGSLLITPEPQRELRLQVDEASGAVQSVVLAGPDGALELRVFAAPRGGDLWSEARPQIAAEVAKAGGTTTEREGPWGPELICKVSQRGDGRPQVTRIIGINGPRWMLRATLLGRPATSPDDAASWEDSIRTIGVQRGAQAMPVGEALPVVMPPQARRVDQPSQ